DRVRAAAQVDRHWHGSALDVDGVRTIAGVDGDVAGVTILVIDGARRQTGDLAPRVGVRLGIGRVSAQRAQGHRVRGCVGRVIHRDTAGTLRILDVQRPVNILDAVLIPDIDRGVAAVANQVGGDPGSVRLDEDSRATRAEVEGKVLDIAVGQGLEGEGTV